MSADHLTGMITSKQDAATVAATRGEAMPRVEIVADRRRAHSAAFRADVVAEAELPGARVEDVAQRHGLSPSLVYRWRRRVAVARPDGDLVHLYPVRIADALDAAPPPSPQPPCASAAPRVGSIEIELPGGVRVRVEETVGAAALRRVMTVLRR